MDYRETFAGRLRDEIHAFLKTRHEFTMRKLAFCTGLLGAGSLTVSAGPAIQLQSNAILYLVPLIAIAFDVYIAADDFRIKRAGAFLKRPEASATREELKYEEYVGRHNNVLAPFTFGMVTIIMLTGAAFMIWKTKPDKIIFFTWLISVLGIECGLVAYTINIRKLLTKE